MEGETVVKLLHSQPAVILGLLSYKLVAQEELEFFCRYSRSPGRNGGCSSRCHSGKSRLSAYSYPANSPNPQVRAITVS